jgi:hypothetical protein
MIPYFFLFKHRVNWSGVDSNIKTDNFAKEATHKKPECNWKLESFTEFGSSHFLKFQLAVKFLLKHRIGDQFQI